MITLKIRFHLIIYALVYLFPIFTVSNNIAEFHKSGKYKFGILTHYSEVLEE